MNKTQSNPRSLEIKIFPSSLLNEKEKGDNIFDLIKFQLTFQLIFTHRHFEFAFKRQWKKRALVSESLKTERRP